MLATFNTVGSRKIVTASTTIDLAKFAASLTYESLPAQTREVCKSILLDTLACAVAGHAGDETSQIAKFAALIAPSSESTVIGGGKLSLAGATLLNGYLVTAVTMCDVHRASATHITPEVVPPALLIAERDNCSGRDLIVALAAGLEVTARIGLGANGKAFRARGFHGPGIFGPFGGAAAVGRLRGFSGETMAQAFGLAGSQAGGTFAAWGTPTVKFHQSRGALSGLLAALLAEQGFLATTEFLTAKDGGLYNAYSDGGDPAKVTADLGARWELEQISLRLWPAAAPLQGLITVLFDALGERACKLADIQAAKIRLAPPVFNMHGKLQGYKSKFDAMISAHYVAAAILQDHALTLDQFEAARCDDPVLRAAAVDLIDIQPDETLKDSQVTVALALKDGTHIEKRCDIPRGSPENPLSRRQIEDKLRTYGKKRLSASDIEKVIALVNSLEEVKSIEK